MDAIFLYNPAVVQFDYGRSHPFRLERLWLTEFACRNLGLFMRDHAACRSFSAAEIQELEPAHHRAYLNALQTASVGEGGAHLRLHGLGSGDNPVFTGLWEYALYTAGGSLAAARLIADGDARRVFHPGGGLHHAMHDHASGFCYVNDVVLAIRLLLERGRRVFYLDLDAHHGDGVQTAFYGTPLVMTLSIHQDGRTLFPGTGFTHEVGTEEAAGFSVNVPLLPAMSDPEYERVWAELVTPLLDAFQPDVVVTELGADALLGDPLANLELRLPGWWKMMRSLAERRTAWLALGGGGYDLSNAMRAWTLAWAAMIEWEPEGDFPTRPAGLPGAAAEMAWPEDFWSPTAAPSPWRAGSEAIDAIIADVRRRVFPHHGL